eukprot:scaffold71844_cov46-Phaeocystis_antarctica.AAC.1
MTLPNAESDLLIAAPSYSCRLSALRSARSEPARSTRLIFDVSSRPASAGYPPSASASACCWRSWSVKMACEREERSFMRVAATCRALLPSVISRSSSLWLESCTSVLTNLEALAARAEQVTHDLVVQLEVGRGHHTGARLARLLHAREQVGAESRYDAEVRGRAHDRVALATAGLAVGEDRAVVPLEGAVEDLPAEIVVELRLRRLRTVDVVEAEVGPLAAVWVHE